MTFVKGKSGNPSGRSREQPFLKALKMEIASAGDNQKALRRIANKLLDEAYKGEPWAIGMIADRLDGKAIQQIDANINDERSFTDFTASELFQRIESTLTRIGEFENRAGGQGESANGHTDICKLN